MVSAGVWTLVMEEEDWMMDVCTKEKKLVCEALLAIKLILMNSDSADRFPG